MSFRSLRFAFVASLAACIGFVAPLAAAQTPPIKPGLWQVKQIGGDSQASARAAASLDKLQPAQRAQVEAMMKQRGIAFGASGIDLKICMTKETLDPTLWEHRANCKTDFSSRTSSTWKFHTTCPSSQTDGEIVFAGSEGYTVNVSTQVGNPPKTRQMSMQGKWLGARCGEIQPIGKN